MTPSLRIGAIDDDRMLLQGLAAWLEPLPDLTLLRTAATVAEYLAEPVDVDVVLLDLNLRDGSNPGRNVRDLLDAGAAVLVVSTIPDQEHVLATIEAGAAGYITKDNDLPSLIESIRAAAQGELAVSPELAFLLSTDARP